MDILEIANKINNCGGRLYLVGGALRDSLLNKDIYDEDYCVVGIDEEEFLKLFPTAHPRGKSFKVYDLENKEFALARIEKKTGTGHKQFDITVNKDITIVEDLSRRDITINAMAKDVITEETIDPYNGQADLKNRIIRATTEKFLEDPLRVYRVARFAAILDFKVDTDTINKMQSLKNELITLSKERVFTEFKKALMAKEPSIFFDILRKADVLDVHFKEINDLIGVEQPVKYHPEGDAYNHTMIVLDSISKNTDKLEIRFAGLVHDLGKGITPKKEYPHHYGHDKKGVKLVKELGDRIGVPNTWIKCGKVSASEHMRGGIFSKMRPAKQVEFLEKVDRSCLGLDGLQLVVNADKGKRENLENFADLGKELLCKINGKYILNKYGDIGGLEIKQKLYEERISYIKTMEK